MNWRTRDAILADVRAAPVFLVFLGLAGAAVAASVDVAVKDAKGAPVADAVVWAVPKVRPATQPPREAAVEQRDKQFVPLVTVVQAGTLVQFPNRDVVRHHVYSFSTPKTFEIKLYVGTPVAPVLFDQPGEVVLGCNIHDNMLAYIYVVDTPYFAKTGADGSARLEGLSGGEYEIQLWHHAQGAAQPARALKLRADESASATFAVPLRNLPPRPGRS